jgi:ABC-type lipoprotein export system ATPase subunit
MSIPLRMDRLWKGTQMGEKKKSVENDTIIECENLVKIYRTKDSEVLALQGLDLKVKKGEIMAIIGNSGSGKSTLLNMIGGLDTPSAGTLRIDNRELFKCAEKELNLFRRNTVGFVWQNNARNLLPYLSALDNVLITMVNLKGKEKLTWANELLEMTGLYHRRSHNLYELSGGEQQRVAIAIALSNKPPILLADEPTGSVDTETTGKILDIFRKLNNTLGTTIIIVTHDLALSKKVDRIVAIRDGKVSSEFIHKRFYKSEFERIHEHELSDSNESHIEMVVMDRAGRLQLPGTYIDELKRRGHNKLIVTKEGDRIILSVPKK